MVLRKFKNGIDVTRSYGKYKAIILDDVVLFLNRELHNKLYGNCDINKNYLTGVLGTTEINEILKEKIEKDGYGKNIKICLDSTENNFKDAVLDEVWESIVDERALAKANKKANESEPDFSIEAMGDFLPSMEDQYSHLDFSKKINYGNNMSKEDGFIKDIDGFKFGGVEKTRAKKAINNKEDFEQNIADKKLGLSTKKVISPDQTPTSKELEKGKRKTRYTTVDNKVQEIPEINDSEW